MGCGNFAVFNEFGLFILYGREGSNLHASVVVADNDFAELMNIDVYGVPLAFHQLTAIITDTVFHYNRGTRINERFERYVFRCGGSIIPELNPFYAIDKTEFHFYRIVFLHGKILGCFVIHRFGELRSRTVFAAAGRNVCGYSRFIIGLYGTTYKNLKRK